MPARKTWRCGLLPLPGRVLVARPGDLTIGSVWLAFRRSAAVFLGFLASRLDLFCALATAASNHVCNARSVITDVELGGG